MIFNPKSYVNLILVSLTRTGGKKQSSRFSRTWGALMESAVHILSAGGCTHTWRALCISWARRHFPGVQRREYRECGRGAFKMCGRVLRENMGSNSRARRVIGDSGEKKEIIFGEFKRDLEKIILNGLGVWYVIFLGDKPYFFFLNLQG